jgi:hypothetical protein
MENIQWSLDSVVRKISDENYEQSFACCRFWFDIAQTYHQIPSDLLFETILSNRGRDSTKGIRGESIHTTAHLILRFASDVESDPILAPHNVGLQSRLCARILQDFFSGNLGCVRGIETSSWDDSARDFRASTHLIARWANLGYVEEAAVRNHILQSLISHPNMNRYQADALMIVFKVAGATFEAYAGPSVVDRCFELLRDRQSDNQEYQKLVQVRTLPCSERCRWAETAFQELAALRERGWEGLPPPPVFTTGKLKPPGPDQKDPSATHIATSLGLSNRDPEPQIPQPFPLEPVVIPEAGTIPTSPITQSPSISIATLSDFTLTDTSDDEPPIDPTVAAPDETFNFEEGNVEVLCGNTLFRVHTSVLSLHSPVLRRMFARTSLTAADSPNGCPRITCPDTATDFSILLKTMYLPG